MELFTWLWVYDKRILCGLKHQLISKVYIWLLPMLLATISLVYSRLTQRDGQLVYDQDGCIGGNLAAINLSKLLQDLVLY